MSCVENMCTSVSRWEPASQRGVGEKGGEKEMGRMDRAAFGWAQKDKTREKMTEKTQELRAKASGKEGLEVNGYSLY